jgi:hypothetical protein
MYKGQICHFEIFKTGGRGKKKPHAVIVQISDKSSENPDFVFYLIII